MTNEHWPHAEAPDYGGLNGRFADLWIADRLALVRRWERCLHVAAVVLCAVAGVVIAWGMEL